MEGEHPSESEPGIKPKPTVAWALDIERRAELVTGRPRQIVSGGLLGVCFLFLATLIGLQHLDPPLTLAVRAFAVAVPALAIDFMFASYVFKPGPGELLTTALSVAV